MEMKVEGENFYMLEAREEKWIYDTEESATASLKEKISEDENLNSGDVILWEVKPRGEKWQIREVPWSKIAIGMIRGKK